MPMAKCTCSLFCKLPNPDTTLVVLRLECFDRGAEGEQPPSAVHAEAVLTSLQPRIDQKRLASAAPVRPGACSLLRKVEGTALPQSRRRVTAGVELYTYLSSCRQNIK